MDFENRREEIRPFLEKTGGNITKLRLLIKKTPELQLKLKEILAEFPVYESELKLARSIYNNFTLPKCLNCSKSLTYTQYQRKQQFCSSECSKHSTLGKESARSKREKTMQERYGASNASNIDIFCEKRKQTNLRRFNKISFLGTEDCKKALKEKYNVDNAIDIPGVKEKIRETTLKRYGTEYASQNTNIKEKTVQTNLLKYGVSSVLSLSDYRETGMLKKYGVSHPMYSPEIISKIKKTLLENYGVSHNMFLSSVQEKRKATCLERYGVETPLANKEIQDKIISTSKERYWNHFLEKINKLKDITLLTSKEEYIRTKRFRFFKFKCNKCNKEFESYLTSYRAIIPPICPFCNKGNKSASEHQFLTYVSSLLPNHYIKYNDRSVISKELDVYIPDKNIAFEFNGLYWHSEQKGKHKYYHLNKTEECSKQGIQLIHIFEDEWLQKQKIVKSRVKHLLGLTKYKIYARRCTIKLVETEKTNQFIEKYHIQGSCVSKINLGLFYKEHLVALMTFGKSRFNKKYDWELLRYCTISNFKIIGGASKLFSHFRKNYNGSIISYADKRWSNGNLYRQLGFNELNDSKPNYFYIISNKRHSRIQFQKHKLKDRLDLFDENLSEYENMLKNGYNRIWDCGNKVFVI